MSDLLKLVAAIKLLAMRGLTPATSSNFSLFHGQKIWVTRSGLHKGAVTISDFIPVDLEGVFSGLVTYKPSDETLIHTTLYKLYPQTKCILHIHSQSSTAISQEFLTQGQISFQGHEIQKAFLAAGKTHHSELTFPILQNSQDMKSFSLELEKKLKSLAQNPECFLMAGHGLYAWGESVDDALRVLEAMEFLLNLYQVKALKSDVTL